MRISKSLLAFIGLVIVLLTFALFPAPAQTPASPPRLPTPTGLPQATQQAQVIQATQWAFELQATQEAAQLAANLKQLEFEAATMPYKFALLGLALVALLVIIGVAVFTLVNAKAVQMRIMQNDESVYIGTHQVVIPALSTAPILEKDRASGKTIPGGVADAKAQLQIAQARNNARIAGNLPRLPNQTMPHQFNTDEPIQVEYIESHGHNTRLIIDEVENKLLES